MKRTLPPVLPADQLAELLGDGLRVLDVRTPGEFESVHIRGSYNVPLDTLGEHAREVRSQVGAPVVLVCQSGSRARRAEEALRNAGMPHLHVLDGGLNAWMASGLPVERGAPRLSLERQVRMLAGALAATGAFLALMVSPAFALVPAFVGLGLVHAAATDSCVMGLLLARLPYNRPASCDVEEVIRSLRTGEPKSAHAGATGPASIGEAR